MDEEKSNMAEIIFPNTRYDANGQKYIVPTEDRLEELEMFKDVVFQSTSLDLLIQVVNAYLRKKNG